MASYSYDRTAESQAIGLERRRRQRGLPKLDRQRRYRRERSKAKRQSEQWRKRNRSQVKRYQKRYQKNPSRFKMKHAQFTQIPIWDLTQNCPGEVIEFDPEQELLSVLIEGQPMSYDALDCLNSMVFMTEEGELALLDILDDRYEYEADYDRTGSV